MRRSLFPLSVFLILTLCVFSFPAMAGEETVGDSAKGMGVKFGRGLWNIVSSPAEIPCTIASDMSGNRATGFFTGFGKGTVFMLRRILVGVDEVATFVIPMEATLPPVCTQGK